MVKILVTCLTTIMATATIAQPESAIDQVPENGTLAETVEVKSVAENVMVRERHGIGR